MQCTSGWMSAWQNGPTFKALDMSVDKTRHATNTLYLHLRRDTRKRYVGNSVQEAGMRWFSGLARKNNRRFVVVIKRDE